VTLEPVTNYKESEMTSPLKVLDLAIKHLIEIPSKRYSASLFNLGGETSYRVIDLAKLLAI
jgi:hypothetical protein